MVTIRALAGSCKDLDQTPLDIDQKTNAADMCFQPERAVESPG
jgi:hypothetical protein